MYIEINDVYDRNFPKFININEISYLHEVLINSQNKSNENEEEVLRCTEIILVSGRKLCVNKPYEEISKQVDELILEGQNNYGC